MPSAATPSAGTTKTKVTRKFDPQPAQPPKIKREGRRSPYLPEDDDTLRILFDVLKSAQDTDNPWISPIDPRDTITKARIAMGAYKKALARFTETGDKGCFVARVWETEPRSGQFQFALALKKGAK
jgi:hypothetical protein